LCASKKGEDRVFSKFINTPKTNYASVVKRPQRLLEKTDTRRGKKVRKKQVKIPKGGGGIRWLLLAKQGGQGIDRNKQEKPCPSGDN